MAGSIQQIQQELTTLDHKVSELAQEFEKVYQTYLTALGEAVSKQLILACYHLCTHGYPESFLKLSFSQRQQFQQNLQQLGQTAQDQLLTFVTNFQILPQDNQSKRQSQQSQFQEEQPEAEMTVSPSLSSPLSQKSQKSQRPPTLPEQLIDWQEQIESAITHLLNQLSRETNFLLQHSDIFAPKLPEAILEAASQADAAAETIAGPPNILNIMIETEDAEDPQSASITRLMTIHLRLSEIEFADATLMTERHQIRSLSSQLSQLKHDYHKKQREKAVLEAESAWRASWFEPEK
jgi:hypothetical protein